MSFIRHNKKYTALVKNPEIWEQSSMLVFEDFKQQCLFFLRQNELGWSQDFANQVLAKAVFTAIEFQA